jgi:putative ABC transport system permease protein
VLPLTFADRTIDLPVTAVVEPSQLAGSTIVPLDVLQQSGQSPVDSTLYVARAPGSDAAAVTAAIDTSIADLPTITAKDQAAFAAEQRAPVDQILTIVYALLGLAVIIAVLGIVNTLALSVIERTREVGLLRAVGLSRRQLRSMVRLESVAIAVLGAVLGVGLGLVFGISLRQALSGDGVSVLSVPRHHRRLSGARIMDGRACAAGGCRGPSAPFRCGSGPRWIRSRPPRACSGPRAAGPRR